MKSLGFYWGVHSQKNLLTLDLHYHSAINTIIQPTLKQGFSTGGKFTPGGKFNDAEVTFAYFVFLHSANE